MIGSRKILMMAVAFCLTANGLSAAAGSGIKLQPISLAQVMSTLVLFMSSKYDRGVLYTVLNAADKEKGLQGSAAYLRKSIQGMMESHLEGSARVDFFGLTIQMILFATIVRVLELRDGGDEERASGLSRDIKVARDALFNLLQPSLNDSNYSPRGSSGEITPRRKISGTTYLRTLVDLSPESYTDARREYKAQRKAAQERAKLDGLNHMRALLLNSAAK